MYLKFYTYFRSMPYLSKTYCSLIALLSLNSANLFVFALPHVTTRQLTSDYRADEVKAAFKHAWAGYSQYAYGHDELLPVTNSFSDSRNGWGASLFDALDTMIIMGLEEEYETSLKFVEKVNWSVSSTASKTFETCIRYLGGLMSAYDLRPNQMLLDKAIELVDFVLLPAFNTTHGVPTSFVDVTTKTAVPHTDIILSEFALQLELVRFSQLTGDASFERLGNSIIEKISKTDTPIPGLYSIFWDSETFKPKDTYITISGGGDSFYEYLLKTHLLMDGNEELQLDMWQTAVESMYNYLRSVANDGSVYLSQDVYGYRILKTGELVCFMPGNLLLGAKYLQNDDMAKFAEELLDSCYKTWKNSPTGLSPEGWGWIDDSPAGNMSSKRYTQVQRDVFNQLGFIPTSYRYLLRPETIESLFYFYRLTGETKYQDMAWEIFQSIEKHCKTSSGYASINNILRTTGANTDDFQESFFFAETLKYLYLIFSDTSLISLDEYVFNTEAHPFKLNKPIKVQKI
ncbi:glycoside hydrolase [Helicostylum pulchrum]|nr:glycoside hydrolase [Helicostylum pulchrum]